MVPVPNNKGAVPNACALQGAGGNLFPLSKKTANNPLKNGAIFQSRVVFHLKEAYLLGEFSEAKTSLNATEVS